MEAARVTRHVYLDSFATFCINCGGTDRAIDCLVYLSNPSLFSGERPVAAIRMPLCYCHQRHLVTIDSIADNPLLLSHLLCMIKSRLPRDDVDLICPASR